MRQVEMLYTASSLPMLMYRPLGTSVAFRRAVRGVYFGCQSTVTRLSADGSHIGMVGSILVGGPLTATPSIWACISIRTRPVVYRHWARKTEPMDVRA